MATKFLPAIMNVDFGKYFLTFNFVLHNLFFSCQYDVAFAANLWSRVNIPDEQLDYYFNLNPKLKKKCENDEKCPYKSYLNGTRCYGYERTCKSENRLFMPECPEDSQGWVRFRPFWFDIGCGSFLFCENNFRSRRKRNSWIYSGIKAILVTSANGCQKWRHIVRHRSLATRVSNASTICECVAQQTFISILRIWIAKETTIDTAKTYSRWAKLAVIARSIPPHLRNRAIIKANCNRGFPSCKSSKSLISNRSKTKNAISSSANQRFL